MTERTLDTVKSLSREDILRGGANVKVVEVPVPDWGGRVFVRGMTGRQRDRVEQLFVVARQRNQPVDNARGIVCAYCLCNEQGVRLFDDNDAGALGELDANIIDLIYDTAARLSGIKADSVEGAEKN